MRSTFRTLFALLLAVIMVFGLCTSALAVNTSAQLVEYGTYVPEETTEEPAAETTEAGEEEAPAEEVTEEATEAGEEEAAAEETPAEATEAGEEEAPAEEAAPEATEAGEEEAPAEEAAPEATEAGEEEAPAEEVTEEATEAGEDAAAEETAEEATEAGEDETAEEASEFNCVGYLMYADSTWTNQYWYDGNEYPVTAANAEITGPGQYTVGLTFNEEAQGLAFAAIGIDGGEIAFPTYTIEVNAIRVNGQDVAFTKGYTSSDDGVTMRYNLYNEWVSSLPEDARSFDGSLEGAAAINVNRDDFAAVQSVEVDFTVHQYGVDTAYLMYADSAWANQFWYDGNEYPVTATTATIDGFGDYTVGLAFDTPAEGLAFSALGIVNGEKTYPGAFIRINAIRVNGEEIAFEKGYTSSDDGVTTRMNIYNEWVSALPEDARSFDGTTEGAAPIIVDPAAFASVSSVEVDFTLVPVTDVAYLMFADTAWANQYWYDGNEYPVTATTAVVDGQGSYTVGLAFNEPVEGVAFAAVGIANGEKTFNGYFIDITDIKINGESINFTGGYTSSDDGVTTRENIYNEWVSALPADARRADGQLEGASSIIVDPADFTAVSTIEVTFDYIYGRPIVADENAPMSADEAAALISEGFNAYIGVQGTTTYVFRNAWNDSYGLNDENNPGFFNRLTGWDESNNALDMGGTFVDAQITGTGEYAVSLTTGEQGFGATEAFNLLFVSTDIPGALVRDGFVTIDNVRVKIGDAATREYTNVDASGEYVMIKVIDTYNIGEAPFGYTVPGPDTSITITFNFTVNETPAE